MKKLFTFLIIANLAFAIQAQNDIINTLGATGSFKVNKNDGTNFLKIDNTYGSLDLGGGPSSSYLNGGRDLNLVKEGGSAGITLTAISNGQPSRARIDFAKANGTIGALSTLVDNDEVSYLTFYGHDGDGYHLGASMEVSVDGTVSSGTIPMQFDFQTNDASRLTIKADGKVGIGTTTPTSTLEVSGSLSLPYKVLPTESTYVVTESDYTIIPVNECIVTLPDPATCSGRVYVIKRPGGASGNVTIQSDGTSVLIDGFTEIVLENIREYIKVQSAGVPGAPATTWVIIGSYIKAKI